MRESLLRCCCVGCGQHVPDRFVGSQERSQHCGRCAQWAIGATRCDDKCANTVLLETQRPCGSVRKCSGDTVTHDTIAQRRCHSIMCFDAVAAFGQAPETELRFIQPPKEHKLAAGEQVLWQCLKVSESKRKGANTTHCSAVERVSGKPQAEFEVADNLLFD